MEQTKPTNALTVRAVGVKYGLISGTISIFTFLILVFTGQNAFDNVWGWVRMGISVVILVMAHVAFKSGGDGFMSYGQGVGIGFWMTLVSLALGGLFTWLYITVIDATVMDSFYEAQRVQMEQQGTPEGNIEMAQKWTKTLFWPIFVFAGMFFGVLLAVIVSIFTQKKNPNPLF